MLIRICERARVSKGASDAGWWCGVVVVGAGSRLLIAKCSENATSLIYYAAASSVDRARGRLTTATVASPNCPRPSPPALPMSVSRRRAVVGRILGQMWPP